MGKRKSSVGFWIVIILLLMMLSGSFLLNIGLAVSHVAKPSGTSGNNYPVDESPDFDEIWSCGGGGAKVARIPLVGVIMRGQREKLFGYEPDMVEMILSQVQAASNDEDVQAIILEVDTPGGGVTPSDEIYNALMRFKAGDPKRMVIVYVRDLAASGGYYAAMAGDYLMAEPTSVVGSVGVIMQAMNFKGLSEKVGLSAVTITSGKNKDILNPFEAVNPEHVAMMQSMIDDMYDRFAGIVVDARGFENRDLLDGRVFTAGTALENGFIDGIGYWDDVLAKTADLLGEEDLYVFRYTRKTSFMDAFLSAKVPALPDLAAVEAPRFMYLWKP